MIRFKDYCSDFTRWMPWSSTLFMNFPEAFNAKNVIEFEHWNQERRDARSWQGQCECKVICYNLKFMLYYWFKDLKKTYEIEVRELSKVSKGSLFCLFSSANAAPASEVWSSVSSVLDSPSNVSSLTWFAAAWSLDQLKVLGPVVESGLDFYTSNQSLPRRKQWKVV